MAARSIPWSPTLILSQIMQVLVDSINEHHAIRLWNTVGKGLHVSVCELCSI